MPTAIYNRKTGYSARRLIGSGIIESATYCNHKMRAHLYLNSTQNTSVNWIIGLLLLLLCWAKVILLSGGHCTKSNAEACLFSASWFDNVADSISDKLLRSIVKLNESEQICASWLFISRLRWNKNNRVRKFNSESSKKMKCSCSIILAQKYPIFLSEKKFDL